MDDLTVRRSGGDGIAGIRSGPFTLDTVLLEDNGFNGLYLYKGNGGQVMTNVTALNNGRLAPASFGRLEKLCARLGDWIEEPAQPSLIHGDLWDGNILVADGRIAAVLDPAIYYADREIELAFTTLFGTFGEAFFARYGELRPIAPGFFEARRELYNLYPLLVHATLFGGGYGQSVDLAGSRAWRLRDYNRTRGRTGDSREPARRPARMADRRPITVRK